MHIQFHAWVTTACKAPSGPPHVGTGWWDRFPSPQDTSPAAQPGPSWEGPRLPPPTTCMHTRAAGHAHAELRVPTVQEAGGGGLSTQSPGCCQNPSESCSPQPAAPPRPPSPAVEVTIAGADTHPPNSLILGRLLFHNLSQRLELGDRWPCLPPGPPPTGAQLILPLLSGRRGPVLWWGPFP
jgi:hypothetical protein